MSLNYNVILSELDSALKTSDFTDLHNFISKIN